MDVSLICVLCALLLTVDGGKHKSFTLMPHVMVVEVDGTLGHQPLTCLEWAENGTWRDGDEITWQKDGEEKPVRGNTYQVELEESLGGGNYTCHSKNGTLLNHTMVLIQEDEREIRKIVVKTDEGSYIKCSTQNYNGEFQCSWRWHPTRRGKVIFVRAQRVTRRRYNINRCSVDASRQQWTCSSAEFKISCSVDASGHGITCLDRQHCPYGEETQRISLSVYVMSQSYLVEKYSQEFYLSEIVKPDMVEISRVNKTTIEWRYPSSWNSPSSYFPLTFEVRQLGKACRTCDHTCTAPKPRKSILVNFPDMCQLTVGHKVKAVCIRAQDSLSDSQWSEWSLYRMERRRHKNRHIIKEHDKLLGSTYNSHILK